jgi:hypothetical protein
MEWICAFLVWPLLFIGSKRLKEELSGEKTIANRVEHFRVPRITVSRYGFAFLFEWVR